MTMQELRADDKAAGRKGAKGTAPRQAPEEPAFDGEYKELHARWRRERIRQEEIFEANREEILATHPGKHIAVCEGEIIAADTALGAMQAAMQAHTGHAAFYYSPVPLGNHTPAKGKDAQHADAEAAADEAYRAELARGRRESSRQQKIFEANREEILATHPGKHIAVCEGKVLVADTATEVDQAVMREHPGRAAFFYSPGVTCVTMF